VLKAGAAAVAVMLFLLLYVFFRFSLEVWWRRFSVRQRLRRRRRGGWAVLLERAAARFQGPYGHLADLLHVVGWPMRPETFAGLSAFTAAAGVAAGVFFFRNARSAVLLMVMLGLLPYVVLRMRLIGRQMAARLDFLPAVELFYQCYLVTGGRQIRTALRQTVEEGRLPAEIQAVFEQFERNLSVRGNDEDSLRRFALAVGHRWADYFAGILRVALTEGVSVADNLRELIADMRQSQLMDQQERHRLLEIRLANFAPGIILLIFLVVNFRLNPDASYRYYFGDPGGRDLLLNALLFLFGSLLMGLHLSRKKM